MSATNTGWRLMILDAAQVNLTLETSPILMELVSPGPQGASAAGGGVTSVNGATGAVVLGAADVGAAAAAHGHAIADVSGLQTALDGKAASSHTHGVGDVTGLGTAATRNVPATGNAAASEAVLGSDTRLTNARTPTSHASSHSTLGDDPIDALSIGAAPSVHPHGNLTSDGRLGTTAGRPVITGTGGVVTVGNFGTNAGQYCEGNDSRLSNARTPTGHGSTHAAAGTDPLTVGATDRILGRSSAGAGSVEEIVCTAWARGLLDDADAATARATLGLGTTDSPQFARVNLQSGEYIRNTVNGRLDFMPDPHPSGDFGIYFDLTSSADYAIVGTIDSAGNLNTNAGFQFANTLAIASGKYLDFGFTGGLASYFAGSGNNGVWQFAPYIGSGHAGAMCLVSQSGLAAGNRRPATAHTNPTFYFYAAGDANANDFARISHDATDGTLESGRGKMRIKAATRVRIEGSAGGFDLPAGDGTNGQVPTTDGAGNVSWQTPSGGGGGVTEAFAIAMAVAL
jgi:hypothetical protein